MNTLDDIRGALAEGTAVPYLGPDVLSLCGDSGLPATAEVLADKLSAKASVPFKIRRNLTAAAQYIENFKHRKTLVGLMKEAFASHAEPSALQRYLAALPLPLVVETWYDGTLAEALGKRADWGRVQGVSRAEYREQWVRYYAADGSEASEETASAWTTLLYQPIGAVRPAANFIVSDSDYVEVLTEIDIQTPIPARVQELRRGRRFLFLGCRFNSQLTRSYARQIMKRSSDGPHWAVVPGELTANEARFFAEQNISRLDMELADFAAALRGKMPAAA
ncbi:MAG: SIR2 family protein [Sulfuricellaceae bacterium]